MGSAGLVWDQKPTFFGILDLGDFWPGRLGWARMGSSRNQLFLGSSGLVWDQKPTFFGILDLGDFWPGRLGWARLGSSGTRNQLFLEFLT